MKKYFSDIIENPKIEIITLCLIIQFYLFRTAIPFLKYPFIVLFAIYLSYLIFFRRTELFNSFKNTHRNYFLVLILFIYLLISFFLTGKYYLIVFKDIINAVILLVLFVNLNITIKSRKELFLLINYFSLLVIYLAILISINGLLDILDIYKIVDDSVKIDYNFSLLPILFGFISIIYLLIYKKLSIYEIIILNILLVLFTINIALSGSRRGMVMLLIICNILIILSSISLFVKGNYYLQKAANVTKNYILMLLMLLVGVFYYINNVSCGNRNRFLRFIGTDNITKTRKEIALNIYRYYFFNEKKTYSEFYNAYFNLGFDQLDPDCGWGFEYGKIIYPLVGNHIEIIPKNAIGCLVDSTSFVPKQRRGISTVITSLNSKGDHIYRASVFCYVSEDFDGYFARLAVDLNHLKESKIRKKAIDSYDLKKKGVWQRLEIEVDYLKGDVPIKCIVYKGKLKKIMQGYVIFAYPEINKVENKRSHDDFLKDTKLVDKYSNNKDFPINPGIPFLHSFLPKDSLCNILFCKKDNSVPLEKNSIKAIRTNLFPLSIIGMRELVKIDEDPIRNLAFKFISEDTAYFGYKNDLYIDTLKNKFSGPRINRWRFAWQIFSKEYNWREKVFGGGFDFLNWYGYCFYKDKTKSDYPHNPFLYILLYSGLIGFILYSFFIYKVFYLYIKYIKEYYLVFIFFLITFFFTFFSGGNPFDPPIMGFFVILPFFIHSIHKKEKSEIEK